MRRIREVVVLEVEFKDVTERLSNRLPGGWNLAMWHPSQVSESMKDSGRYIAVHMVMTTKPLEAK